MTSCATQDCPMMPPQGYKYCLECYGKWKAGQAQAASTSTASPTLPGSSGRPWHEKPEVDALLKINSNLGRIVTLLERIAEAKER